MIAGKLLKEAISVQPSAVSLPLMIGLADS
jgi:hypothetical protein